MVHRAPDSRLLTNLIANEKEYAKHYAALFPLSHTALASLSAYAAASPVSPAQTIAAIVNLFASADDALQRYANVLDAWREQLVALKALEDDLSTVLRDRDILVTRLIKASKASRDAHRSSLRLAPLSGIGSASLSSLPSSSSSAGHATPTGASPASTNAKLAQAQAELQACEAHLVSKERELEARRMSVARDGLGARCRALIDCGWVWGEMGKQGLRALQALGANASGLAGTSVCSPTPSLKTKEEHGVSVGVRTRGSVPMYASDSSSLTPSQSASQTAARSAEASQEGRTSKEHESAPDAQADLTIVVPPAHAIPELTLPTVVRPALPQNSGDGATRTYGGVQAEPVPTTAPGPRRRRTKRDRRPPSQHIVEVSDEGSESVRPPAPNANANANAGAHVGHPAPARTTFPTTTTTTSTITRTTTTNGAHDNSSDDNDPAEPLQVVENDPFEIIRRRSALGPQLSTPVPALPSAPPGKASSEPGPSPSKLTFAGIGLGRGPGAPTPTTAAAPAKRERRTSMAFFGSLRGLFRKPKERAVGAESDEVGPSSSKKSNGHAHTNTNGGWVTRTDARIKGGQRRRQGAGIDSDSDLDLSLDTGTTAPTTVSVIRGHSGRLRKGRPRGAHAERNGPGEGATDGWATDEVGAGANPGTELNRPRTRRGATKRQKTSVADLRGSEQGHTDGEVNERADQGRGKAEGARSRTLARRPSGSVSKGDTKPSGDVDMQHRRTATTAEVAAATPNRRTADHRRSASIAVMDTHTMLVSTSTQALQKLPPSPPLPSAPPGRSSTELAPKQTNGRRATVGHANGHGRHGPSQSLMSIVADWDGGDEHGKAQSLDLPRAPGSVLQRDSSTNSTSSAVQAQAQGFGQERSNGVKMPLRSALRNASRTPSPSPPPQSPPPARSGNGGKKQNGKVANGEYDARANDATMRRASWRDSLSVSSYATGRESLDGDLDSDTELGPSTGVSPHSSAPVLTIPPPPVDPPPVRVRGAATGEQPFTRRKSVRVSLQPTFSPAPPARRDDDRYGFGSHTTVANNRTWDGDSTSEDEGEAAREYLRAKALLSLVGGEKDKGKARAR